MEHLAFTMPGIRTRKRPHLPRKQPSQARARATVDAILTAAAQVFERLGYTAATTDGVAERAGVSVGTLYQYFPNKDALLVALFERHLLDIANHFDALCAHMTSGMERAALVEELVGRLFEMHRAGPRLHQILLQEAPLPAESLERYAGLEQRLLGALASYLGNGEQAGVAAEMVLVTVENMAHRLTLHTGDPEFAHRAERETVFMLIAYLDARVAT